MLIARGLRLAGLLLAFGFHFALAMDPGDVVFNFSAALIALFFLFLPDDFSQRLSSTLTPLRRAWMQPPNRLAWLVSRACSLSGDSGAVCLAHFSAGDRDWPYLRGVSRRLGRLRWGRDRDFSRHRPAAAPDVPTRPAAY